MTFMKKFLSLLLCAVFLMSAAGCKPTPADPPATEPADKPDSAPTYEEQKAAYSGLIAEYTALLRAKKNGEELRSPAPDGKSHQEALVSETLYRIVDSCKSAERAESLGYGYRDLDGNGTPELILLTKYISILAIFTVSDSSPILLESAKDTLYPIQFARGGRFLAYRSTVADGIEEGIFSTFHISEGKVVYDAVYGKLYDGAEKKTLEMFTLTDGVKTAIDSETFDELDFERTLTQLSYYQSTLKYLSPRIYFPLAEKTDGTQLPTADFSSYTAVIETYKKIASALDKFEYRKWEQGEYDGLFSFPDDLSYEYYNRLMYGAYRDGKNIGYDETDLNGDGRDELVLLTEDYKIKAVFTQKGNTPVLVCAFAFEVCWLDAEGLIHVDNMLSNMLDYSLYELTADGSLNLKYSLVGTLETRCLIKEDGSAEIITGERWSELYYDDYRCYAESVLPNEHTRNVTDLTYTPIEAPTDDLVSAAASETWRKFADHDESYQYTMAHSNTYLSFSEVSETRLTLSLRYAFTYYYPDPERENYVLEEKIETTLDINADKKDGIYAFEQNGISGRLDFTRGYLWLIIDKSTDERFPAGHHCLEPYTPSDNGIVQ